MITCYTSECRVIAGFRCTRAAALFMGCGINTISIGRAGICGILNAGTAIFMITSLAGERRVVTGCTSAATHLVVIDALNAFSPCALGTSRKFASITFCITILAYANSFGIFAGEFRGCLRLLAVCAGNDRAAGFCICTRVVVICAGLTIGNAGTAVFMETGCASQFAIVCNTVITGHCTIFNRCASFGCPGVGRAFLTDTFRAAAIGTIRAGLTIGNAGTAVFMETGCASQFAIVCNTVITGHCTIFNRCASFGCPGVGRAFLTDTFRAAAIGTIGARGIFFAGTGNQDAAFACGNAAFFPGLVGINVCACGSTNVCTFALFTLSRLNFTITAVFASAVVDLVACFVALDFTGSRDILIFCLARISTGQNRGITEI